LFGCKPDNLALLNPTVYIFVSFAGIVIDSGGDNSSFLLVGSKNGFKLNYERVHKDYDIAMLYAYK